jgi:hypothetical protein
MIQVANTAAAKIVDMLTGPDGMNSVLTALAQAEQADAGTVDAKQFVSQNVALEIAERSLGVKYPAVHVYCDRIANELREKFRCFSGRAWMVVEVRHSQDRLEGLDQQVQHYVNAIANVLDQNRGDWGNGLFYTGGYEVAFGPVKQGGRHFVQAAKITFEVGVSR